MPSPPCVRRRLVPLACAVPVLLALGGCKKPIPIKEVASDPKYLGYEVRIRGAVVSSFTLGVNAKHAYYIVSDGTGQMAVETQQGAPLKDAQVTVRGPLEKMPALAVPIVKPLQLAPLYLTEQERQVEEAKGP